MINNKIEIENYFTEIKSCPLCNSSIEFTFKLYEVDFSGFKINVVECNHCGLCYKKYFPNDSYFLKIYGQGYEHFKTDDIVNELKELEHRVKRLGNPKGRLLDYGCGNGSFVLAALRNGWDAYGSDPFLQDKLCDEKLNNRCTKINILDCDLSLLGKFDCITMWATAEHLVDTKETFFNLISLLNDNGVLVFNSPNGKSKISKKNGHNWKMAKITEHLQFQTLKSVSFLAKNSNMSIDNIRICGSPWPLGGDSNDTKNNIQNQLSHPSEKFLITIPSGIVIKRNKLKITSILKNFILHNIIGKNRFWIKDIFSELINILEIGDHIEVRLKKQNK